MKNSKHTAIGLVVLMNLIPTVASGEVTHPSPPTPEHVAISYDELNQVVREFSASGDAAGRTARLFGRVPEACWRHFTVRTTRAASGQPGWEVFDHGNRGRECAATQRTRECNNIEGHADRCLSLSEVVPTLTVPADASGELCLVTRSVNTNMDANDPRRRTETCRGFTPSIRFRSLADVETERARARDEGHDRLIARYRRDVRECRRDFEDLPIARRALRGLLSEGEIEEPAFRRMNEELDRQYLRLLQVRAQRGEVDELDEVREQALAFAESHSENSRYALAAAHIMRTVAMRYVRQREVTEDSFADARATLEDALELSGLDEANRGRVQGYVQDLEIAETAFHCNGGDAFSCAPAYNSMMQGLNERAWNACNGWNPDWNACYTAGTALRSAPAQIQQVITQRQQMQQRVFGAISGGGGSASPFGTPGGTPGNPFLMGSALSTAAPGMPGLPAMGGVPNGMMATDPLATLTMQAHGLPIMPSAPPMASI
ncbi:MAG: hypothetical protein IT285_00930 [Bdellovibrionales bacterium]|nr:hypothetical protein [Bdellovibrionales bacterium]